MPSGFMGTADSAGRAGVSFAPTSRTRVHDPVEVELRRTSLDPTVTTAQQRTIRARRKPQTSVLLRITPRPPSSTAAEGQHSAHEGSTLQIGARELVAGMRLDTTFDAKTDPTRPRDPEAAGDATPYGMDVYRLSGVVVYPEASVKNPFSTDIEEFVTAATAQQELFCSAALVACAVECGAAESTKSWLK